MQISTPSRGTYLMVLTVGFGRTGEGRFAAESAFAEHLRLIKRGFSDACDKLIVMGREVPKQHHEALKSGWLEIDERAEGIFFVPLHSTEVSNLEFIRRYPSLLSELNRQVKLARVVHSGISTLYRPVNIVALILGAAYGKVTISVSDIDHRKSAWMNYQTGRWSWRQYRTTRLLHDTFAHLQHLLVARMCSLVLLKGSGLAKDYGRGRPNVRNFLDSAYGPEHLVPASDLDQKLEHIMRHEEPLRLTYFGRLVAYKGVDHMLRALKEASAAPDFHATLDVYGDGPERDGLEALSRELGLDSAVTFHGAVPFGRDFFRAIQKLDVLLAAPLSEDTPRSALDAQASGLFVLAYDTYYYRELAEAGAAVAVAKWPDIGALARRLVELNHNRTELRAAILKGVAFARRNTQDQWLEKRFAWTRSALEQSPATHEEDA